MLNRYLISLVFVLAVALVDQNVDAIRCHECRSVTGSIDDCLPTKKPTMATDTQDEPQAEVPEETQDEEESDTEDVDMRLKRETEIKDNAEYLPMINDYTYACTKTTIYIRNGRKVSKMTVFSGVNNDVGNHAHSSLTEEEEKVKNENDAFCTYKNEMNPLLVQLTERVRTEFGGQDKFAGTRTCVCYTDLCNADELMKK